MIFGRENGGAEKVVGYTVATPGASTTLSYSNTVKGNGAFTVNDTPRCALYPYDETAAGDDNGVITFMLPETQYYADNSFGNGSNVAVGVVNNTAGIASIGFKNVCGYLRLKLSATGANAITVSKIVLKTKGTEKLWGTFQVDADDTNPTATKTATEDGGTSITLDCGTGVVLSSTEKTFHFVVPAGALDAGFIAEVYSMQGHIIRSISSTSSKLISRNAVRAIANQTLNWLPSGYSEARYIQSDGTNCINTGVQVSANGYRMECQIAITGAAPGNNPSLFGGVYNNYPTLYKFVSFDNRTSGNHMRALYNSHAKDDDNLEAVYEGADTWKFVNNQIYHLDVCLIKGIQSLKIDGVDLTLHTFDEDVHQNTQNVEVAFLANNEKNVHNQVYFANRFYPTRVYFCNMYNGDNTMVRQFIPAYNGSNYGLYDLVNGVFYTSASGNAFSGN